MSANFKSLSGWKETFNAHAGVRADSYSTSLPYYLLTGRKDLRFFTDGASVVPVCIHPNDDNVVLVFPELPGITEFTAKTLESLLTFSEFQDKEVRLARYAEQDIQNLQEVLKDFPLLVQPMEEKLLDWLYPIHILDTEKVVQRAGKIYEPLRNKVNKAEKYIDYIGISNLPDISNVIIEAAEKWASMKTAIAEEKQQLIAPYRYIAHLMQANPDMFDGFITFDKSNIIGFCLWETPQGNTANGLVSLCMPQLKPDGSLGWYPGQSEAHTAIACNILSEKGIKYYNVGGSETEGLDLHKRKSNPCVSLLLHTLSVQFQSLSQGGIALQGIDCYMVDNKKNDVIKLQR